LLRFDGTNWQPIPLGEAHGDIVCAVQDAQGDYWFGTAEVLVQLQLQKVRTFTARDGLPADNVWSVCQTLDEKIWVGTDRGLAMIQSNQVTAYAVPNGIPFQPFRCVGPARAGGVWVAGQFNGVFKFRNGNIEEQLNVELPGLPNVLCEDKSGRLWVGTSGGVRCFQNGQAQALGPGMESLRDVHAILEDRAGDFWFGLKNGELARLHAGQLSVVTAPAGWPGGGVWAIHEDADGDLWLGTENGLVRRSGVRQDFFSFAAPPQMPADPVNCILEDDFGCLWWSTLHGVFRGERAQLKAVADGKMATFQPFILGTADGMKTAESNGETQPAGWKARDGCLWFPTGKGLVVIDPKLFAAKENPPRALLESVKADGVELDGQANREIKISAGRGHALEFRFTLCDLTAPEQVRFQTRLSGVSDAWSEPTANRAAHFFNLPPGNYRFAVRGMEHHGLWGAPTTWEFFIAPCFWQTWWFYLACAGGVVFLAAIIQAYRLHWQRRLLKIEQQRVLASERARIARDLHDDLGTALTGMALELDVLGRDACGNLPLIDRLAKASQHTRQLAERMREVVWVVNPRCDNLRSLADFLEDQVAGLLHAAGLKVHLEFPLEIPERPMSANVRHQLALSVREAFSNLIRHARATEASVRLELTDELLFIVIRDNGCGFSPPAHVEKEHGLINMRARMEEIGGCFECVSAPGAGTTLTLCVSLQKIQPRDK
jgi:signal transduction histidine kinase/ligand-binding sensor domain-containing protein